MTDIKRYKIEDGLLDFGIKGGLFVRDEDHAAIVAEKDARISELELMLQKKAVTDGNKITALQEQARELAADSSVLKNTVEQCKEFFKAWVLNRISPYNGAYLNALCAHATEETPATDAILREIRAQGVEKFCDLIKCYGKVEPDYFNPDFADLYAKIYKEIYESILDNPAVHDMGSLADWLEAGASNSRAYADRAIEYAAAIRSGEQP